MAETPTHPIRISRDLWRRFGEIAKPSRTAVLREFIRWYVGERGAKMPRRPKPEDASATEGAAE